MSTEPPPNAADDDLAALLGSARRGLSPTADDRARSAAALSAQLAAAAVPKAIGAKGLTAALKGFAGGKLAGLAGLAGVAVSVSVAVAVVRAPTTPAPNTPPAPTAHANTPTTQAAPTTQATPTTPVPATAATAELPASGAPQPAPKTAAPSAGPPSTGAPGLLGPPSLATPLPAISLAVANGRAPSAPSAATTASIAEETRLVRGAETALRQGNSAEALALLAEDWTSDPDGKSYTFTLRQGVKFHNGAPLTATDVLWSWNRYMDPKTDWRCLSEFDGRGQVKVEKI